MKAAVANVTEISATVNLASCTSGTGTNYALNAFFDGNNGEEFPTPSFSIAQSGPTMIIPPAAYATGTVTLAGSNPNNDFGVLEILPWPSSDDGPVSIGVESNNTSAFAQQLASQFSSCSKSGQYFSGVANGPVINLTSCTSGANGNSYPVWVQGSAGGITMVPSGPTLTGGTNGGATYDTGTVSLTVNGVVVASAAYAAGSTSTTIAQALVDASHGNGIVTVTNPSGANVTITAVDGGADSDFSYQVTSASSQPAVFGSPSFSATSSSGDLSGGQNVPLYSWSITSYAPDGDVRAMMDSVMGTWAYSYDDLNRLTSGIQQGGLDLSWDYDRYGNRWDQSASGSGSGSAVQTHFTFNSGTNRIDQFSGNYDADGNLLNDGTNHYGYDAENRLISLNGQSTYAYDSEGRRVAKYSGGSISAVYILGIGGQQVTELNGSGQWSHSNVYAPGGRLIATYEGPAGQATAGYHYHLTDWLGTERVQTNASGVAESKCLSNSFGDGLDCSGTDATEQHFTGEEHDAESGLDYFFARYYSSNFGRFMTPDWAAAPADVPYAQFGDPQSLNLYEYVGNNPNTGIDTDGHENLTSYQSPDAYDPNDDSAVAADNADEQTEAEGFEAVMNGDDYTSVTEAEAWGDYAFGVTVINPSSAEMGYFAGFGAAQQQGDGSDSNAQKRADLASAATSEYHSTKWNPKGGYSQCNVFVCDMLDKVGLDGPRNANGHAITAGQWAGSKPIAGWRILGANEAAAPGDVAAVAEPGVFSNASGHAGIVSDVTNGVPYIIAAGSKHIYRTKASDFVPGYSVVYRRYVGQ